MRKKTAGGTIMLLIFVYVTRLIKVHKKHIKYVQKVRFYEK